MMKRKLTNKEDYMNFIMDNSEEFRVIDNAIPMHLWDDMRDLEWSAYGYYKNGKEGVISLPVETAKILGGSFT